MVVKTSRVVLILVVTIVSLVFGCGGGGGGGSHVVGPVDADVELQLVSDELDRPVFLTAPSGDTHRLFVVEQTGRIRIIRDGTLLSTPFLDLSGGVSDGYEQGLLGLAFDPQFGTTGRFFVSYTDRGGAVTVARYAVSADPNVADAGSGVTLLSVAKTDPLHNGGMIAFGRDGNLFVSLGDGNGQTYDEQGNGQDRTDLFGSILRLDVRGAAYTIPSGNPFGAPSRPELWNYGLRNPWRFSFDHQTGDLYIADVGESHNEEINVAEYARGNGKGVNYGWKILEGTRCSDPGCSTAGTTLPVYEYTHAGNPGACCVIGGYVYRGSAIPALAGSYFFGDLCGQFVRSLRYTSGRATSVTDWPSLSPRANITSFGEDARGELYVLTESGSVFRIAPAPAVANQND